MKAWAEGSPTTTPWENPLSEAPGLRVPSPFAGRQILEALGATDGEGCEVSETEIVDAQKLLARLEGVWAGPEGGATLAALLRLRDEGRLERQSRIVLLLTGAGLKHPPPPLPAPVDLSGPEATLLPRIRSALGL